MSPLMSIGEFALATGLSVKALRFYAERGLLAPADVDPHSGYRSYAPGQVRTATRLRVLRAAGLSLEEVKAALAAPDRLSVLLEEHGQALRRRRDLEDRAMALARPLTAPADDGAAAGGERTSEATPWVGIVMEISLEDGEVAAADDQANAWFEKLARTAVAAGLETVGPLWTAMRPAARGANVVETVMAMPVAGDPPATFAVPGLPTVTGVLPPRVERYVSVQAGEEDLDLLEDAPGGALPHPAMLALMDALDDVPVDSASAAPEVRQILLDPMAGRIELAVTVRELEG
ncbi:MerR family transcriptional regulator [Micrococcus luteus]|uniref:MerR family transcriptional regulator n=1 Tax=Micrococcus luteus TaxID=1270 RepID=UPI00119DFB64|nr:MerR family transcriptional regulator [Micrococcus luteus]